MKLYKPHNENNTPFINLFLGQGTKEAQSFFNKRCQALHEALNNHEIQHDYYIGGNGGHDWSTWRHLLYYRFLPNLWKENNN